jgi:hypothetical protein
MDKQDQELTQRRKVLTMLGTTAVALPVLGLAGCGGKDAPEPDVGAMADDMGSAAEDTMSEMTSAAESAGEDLSSAAEETMQSAEEAVTDAMDEAEAKVETIASDASGGMAKVDENSAQAQGLGYVHEASTVDASKQTRYAAGQQCSNCALYQGGDAEWGGCPLFAGKQVKATGWCNAYAAKPA